MVWIIGYIVGMFVMRALYRWQDNTYGFMSFGDLWLGRMVMMIFWPIFMPLFMLLWLYTKITEIIF